jgi:hypothetical protein
MSGLDRAGVPEHDDFNDFADRQIMPNDFVEASQKTGVPWIFGFWLNCRLDSARGYTSAVG